MKKFLSFALCLMLGISGAMADELTVSDITIPQGGKASLSISLTNTGTYRQLFEFVLTLPEGVTLVANSQKLSNRFQSTTSLDYSVQGERIYKFICTPAGTNTTPISGTSGVLMTVDLQADASLAEGTPSLTGSVTNIELTTSGSQAWNPANQTFSITIGAPADTRVLLDEDNEDEFDDASNVDVRVRRAIVAGVWNTIVLPFSMTAAQVTAAFGTSVKLADFSAWEADGNNVKVTFTEVTAIDANHPYLIKVTTGLTEFTVDGVNIAPVRDDMSGEFDNVYKRVKNEDMKNGYFMGTYKAMSLPVNALFLNDNALWFCTSSNSITIKAFRGYFTLKDVVYSASSRLTFSVDDSGLTGITERSYNNSDSDRVFNLQGLPVTAPAKGIYIINGKKTIIK